MDTPLSIILTLATSMAAMAFFTLLERKVLGYSQLRKGPNKIRLSGLLQPLADGVKLFTKEKTALSASNKIVFYAAPVATLLLAEWLWAIAPSGAILVRYAILIFLAVSRFSVYPTMLAGWSSNSKYSLIGALRRVAQTISYEIRITTILITILMLLKTITINTTPYIRVWIVGPTLLFTWYSCTLAETNRSPYDLAEGERELVSGFNTEYGGPEFSLIFMAEYLSIIFICSLTSLLLFPRPPPWYLTHIIKTVVLTYVFITTRATLPRLRYDRLIEMTWTSYLPIRLLLAIIIVPA